eukprot:TRINITY_DN18261_c0_g1_i1.p1 TRINITY_DN18261_c0_g1~~TRINITY_DN18261_c0_g1_i1.p1  ORF type:complete len:219 (-),score=39.57 TRINITY_DN18261_c0_g1_i1:71-676(-)
MASTDSQEETPSPIQSSIVEALNDLSILTEHISRVIERQLKSADRKHNQEYNALLHLYKIDLGRDQIALSERLQALGHKGPNKITHGVVSLATGFVTSFRVGTASREFRDDFSALAFTEISWQMAYCIAKSGGDDKTAALVSSLAKKHIGHMKEIKRIMPYLVFHDLSEANPKVQLDSSAIQDTLKEGATWIEEGKNNALF